MAVHWSTPDASPEPPRNHLLIAAGTCVFFTLLLGILWLLLAA